ncbi:MAG: glycoside hydrolase family 18 protein [Calditrichaeota bacterium]|nr:glycoside hydrolase family 18 protein [Calditrichota bacterium]
MWSRLNKLVFAACLIVPAFVYAQRIVGYYPSWAIYARNYLVTDIPAEQLTHINYAFANISGGQVVLGDAYADIDRFYPGDCWDPGCQRGNFHQLRILKQLHPQLKTLISVGGWTWSENFSDAAATAEARELFANSCALFVVEHGFDGVDLDWEYPVFGGDWDVEHRPEDGANLTLLCQRIRHKFDSLETLYAQPFLLTLATSAGLDHVADLELPELSAVVDFINVMSYDFQGAWSSFTGFNSPLFADPLDPYSEPGHTTANLDAALQAYIAGGVPRAKLSAGLAFYGRGFGNVANVNNGLYAPFSGVSPFGTWENGMFDYWQLKENFVSQNGYVRYWNDVSRVPWLYNSAAQVMISYDDTASIREKARYVHDEALGGAMFWELAADRDGELLAALSDELTTRFPPPELFVVTFANDSLHLQWTAVPGAASYKVWSSSDAASDPVNYTLELSTGGTHAVLTLPADRMRVFFVTAE